MPPWTVGWAKSARRDLKNLDPPIARHIVEEVDAYALTGRGDVTKLQGSDQFRLRVGDWRVIFALLTDSNTLRVDAVAHRREAYR